MVDDTSGDGSVPEVKPLGEGAAWTVLAYLVSGPLLYGGLGWLLDRWLGSQWIVGVGILFGMALSIYAIVLRYVIVRPETTQGKADSDQGG